MAFFCVLTKFDHFQHLIPLQPNYLGTQDFIEDSFQFGQKQDFFAKVGYRP